MTNIAHSNLETNNLQLHWPVLMLESSSTYEIVCAGINLVGSIYLVQFQYD